MRDWNILATAQPGPQHTRTLLNGLRQYGEFHRTEFRDVCIGRVDDVTVFLDSVLAASEAHAGWSRHLSRVIPVERTFHFTPETIGERCGLAFLTRAMRRRYPFVQPR